MRLNRPTDNFSEAQVAEVNSTAPICGKPFINGRCISISISNFTYTISISNFYSIKITLFNEPITVSKQSPVSLLTSTIASQPSEKSRFLNFQTMN